MKKYIIILIIIIIFYYLHKLCIQSECDNILNTKNNIDEFTNVDETQEQEQEQEKAIAQQEQTLLEIQSKIKENMKAFYALVTQGKDNQEVEKNLITTNSTENFSDMVEIGRVSSVGGVSPREIEEIIQKFRVLIYTISRLPQTNQTMDAFYKLGKKVISLSETQVVVNDLLALVAKVKIHLPKSLNSISQGLTQQVIYILYKLLTYINELLLIYSNTSKNLVTTHVRSGKIDVRSGKIDVAPRAQTSQQNQMAVAQTKAPEQMVAAQQASIPGKIELKSIIAGNRSLNVKWMPPNDGIKVQKYIVAISQDELNWISTEVYENRPGLIEFNIPKGLSNGTKYYIRISGVNSNGSGQITSFIVIPQANQMAAQISRSNQVAVGQQNQIAATQQNQMVATQQNQMAATQQNQMAVAQASHQNQMAVGQTQTKAQEEVKAVEKAQSNASDYDESERNRYEYFTNIQKKDSYLKDKQTQLSICGVGISKNNNMPICMCSN